MAKLSHVAPGGSISMVDVGNKEPTHRVATAEAIVRMQPEALRALRDATLAKGDALAAAQIAGIAAAKRTDELIPLAHTVPLSGVDVAFEFLEPDALRVCTEARTVAQTGVEMEALVAASVAALTIYDMTKALDKGIVIERVALLSKSGGKSGTWRRP
jgi:cyclic pyranopterin phosphate synthase